MRTPILRCWSGTQALGPLPRAVLLSLHGINEHAGLFARPAHAWAKRGISTYAFDQRGFGATPERGGWAGFEAMAADVSAAITDLAGTHQGVPLFLLGHSMGGAVAAALMARPIAPPVAGLILVASAVWARRLMPLYQRAALSFATHLLPGLRLAAGLVDRPATNNPVALAELRADPLVIRRTRVRTLAGLADLMDTAQRAAPDLRLPLLLCYGLRDRIVPAHAVAEFWNRLPKTRAGDGPVPAQRLAIYPNGWHLLLRDLSGDTLINDIAAWLYSPGEPLPSGAEAAARAWCASRPV
jgi:acylglycerol lipase